MIDLPLDPGERGRVSSAPLPRPSAEVTPEPASAEDDGWALLENLRRRLEEQAAQGRRTQQQVTQLAESIGALVEAQRRRARGLNLNSVVADLIFTMLCGAGFYVLYESRAGTLVEARDSAQRERDLAVRRADEAAAKAAAREQADGRAWEVYQLLEAGKRTEATGKLAALRELPLSRTERAILAARAHETQVMAVDAALKAAVASFKAGRHTEVIAPLEAALVSEPAGARGVLMRYYLGVAYARAGQLERAIGHLQAALDADTDQDDARFQLASALDRSGAYARARVEYDRFATAYPQSPLAVFAMRRSATLARMPPVAPAAGQGAVVPPAGGVAPPAGGVVPPAKALVPPAGGVVPLVPTGTFVPPAKAVVPPTGTFFPPTGTVAPPAKPLVPPAGGVAPAKPLVPPAGGVAPAKALVPPAGGVAPPAKALVPPAGGVAPPAKPLVPPAKPVTPSAGAIVPPTGGVAPPAGAAVSPPAKPLAPSPAGAPIPKASPPAPKVSPPAPQPSPTPGAAPPPSPGAATPSTPSTSPPPSAP